MKKTFIIISAFTTLAFAACSDSPTKSGHENHDTITAQPTEPAATQETKETDVKTIPVVFTSVDPNAAASLKAVVDHYLHVKNALVNDNAAEAANGAKAMQKAVSGIDKSYLSADQKSAYDKLEQSLKEHTAVIAKSGTKIADQRTHFASLSETVYELVKNFGAGRTMYHDHCPMARNNQGAMWMSENKEVTNPYFGAEMLNCGTVEEEVK
ncbi:DUF3347 domain-containing protein [Flavihumibacter solisilvae]|uniref:DUF3347 domain-containing protein n=1 Tax=Flavihumibacter solisilvae TaxID=1349421 RepID=UPI000690BD41|nr:DUF3347 domain-containing protein [Flavihumibacter solisilvae]